MERSGLVSSQDGAAEADEGLARVEFVGHVGDELVEDPPQLGGGLQALHGEELGEEDAEGVGAQPAWLGHPCRRW